MSSKLLQQFGGYAATCTAAGSTYADAASLTAALTLTTTVAAGTGVKLPNLKTSGGVAVVRNLAAEAVLVYPPTGGAINGGSANAGVSLAQNKTGTFWSTGDGSYMFSLSA
jgi:hypothetical protein